MNQQQQRGRGGRGGAAGRGRGRRNQNRNQNNQNPVVANQRDGNVVQNNNQQANQENGEQQQQQKPKKPIHKVPINLTQEELKTLSAEFPQYELEPSAIQKDHAFDGAARDLFRRNISTRDVQNEIGLKPSFNETCILIAPSAGETKLWKRGEEYQSVHWMVPEGHMVPPPREVPFLRWGDGPEDLENRPGQHTYCVCRLETCQHLTLIPESKYAMMFDVHQSIQTADIADIVLRKGCRAVLVAGHFDRQSRMRKIKAEKQRDGNYKITYSIAIDGVGEYVRQIYHQPMAGGPSTCACTCGDPNCSRQYPYRCGHVCVYDRRHHIASLSLSAYVVSRPLQRHEHFKVMSLSKHKCTEVSYFKITQFGGLVQLDVDDFSPITLYVPKQSWINAQHTLPDARLSTLSAEHVQRNWQSQNAEIVASYPVHWQLIFTAAAAKVALNSQRASSALEAAIGVRSLDHKITSALANTEANNSWYLNAKRYLQNSWERPFTPTRLDTVNGGSIALTFAENKLAFSSALLASLLIKSAISPKRDRALTFSMDWTSLGSEAREHLVRIHHSVPSATECLEYLGDKGYDLVVGGAQKIGVVLHWALQIGFRSFINCLTPAIRWAIIPMNQINTQSHETLALIQPEHVRGAVMAFPFIWLGALIEEVIKTSFSRRCSNRLVGSLIAGSIFGLLENRAYVRALGSDTVSCYVRMTAHSIFCFLSHGSLVWGSLAHSAWNLAATAAALANLEMQQQDALTYQGLAEAGSAAMMQPWHVLGAAVAAMLTYKFYVDSQPVAPAQQLLEADVETATLKLPDDPTKPFIVSGYCCLSNIASHPVWAGQLKGLKQHARKKGTFLYVWTKYFTHLYPGSCPCNTANAIIKRWLEPRLTNPPCLVAPFLPCLDEAKLDFQFIKETVWTRKYHARYVGTGDQIRLVGYYNYFMFKRQQYPYFNGGNYVEAAFEQRVHASVPMKAAFAAAIKNGTWYQFNHYEAQKMLTETGTYQRVQEAVDRNLGVTNEMTRFTSFTKIEPKGVNCLKANNDLEYKHIKTRAILNTPDHTKLNSGLCAQQFMGLWKSFLTWKPHVTRSWLESELCVSEGIESRLKQKIPRHSSNQGGTLDLDSGIRAYRHMCTVDKDRTFKFNIGCGTASGLWTTTPDNTIVSFTVTSVWMSTWFAKIMGQHWQVILHLAGMTPQGTPLFPDSRSSMEVSVIDAVTTCLRQLQPRVVPMVGDAIENGSTVTKCRDRAILLAMLLTKITLKQWDLLEVDTDVASMDASTSITWQNGKSLIHRASGLIGPAPTYEDMQVALGEVDCIFSVLDEDGRPKRFQTGCDCGQRIIHFGISSLPKHIANCCFKDEYKWQMENRGMYNSNGTAPSMWGFMKLHRLYEALANAAPICGLGDDVKGSVPVLRPQALGISYVEKDANDFIRDIWGQAGFSITGSFKYRKLDYDLVDPEVDYNLDEVAAIIYQPLFAMSEDMRCTNSWHTKFHESSEEDWADYPMLVPTCDQIHSSILSAQPLPTKDGLVMSQKTGRCLAKVGVCEEWRGVKSLSLIKTKATAAFHNNQANPLLRIYLKRLFDSIPGPLYEVPNDNPYALRIPKGLVVAVDDELAKSTICRVYDISVQEYEDFASYLSTVPIPGMLDHPVLTRMLVMDFA